MIWLLGIVLVIQASFYWLLKPVIVLSTPLFELRSFGLLGVLFIVWLLSGSQQSKNF
ncbi:Hypothetical protein P9211_03551 [Prochlorococcus marinus str. MIT 9211]|uniref:Uncharacterized protein n=1 Tax=Prochlorococcus marinus (strain MIT 9211) TaxID=93059 RepID=A9BDX6_PROM4|nr:Hypothetical protein P9211_03551 [Prochlorococcus marinus str. MIT 9211]